MSRVGSSPVAVPSGVDVKSQADEVVVKGKHGQLSVRIPDGITFAYDQAKRELTFSRQDDRRELRALHGLIRALVANTVRGVVEPWEKRLEIVGVGYQASLASGKLTLNVGFANPIVIALNVISLFFVVFHAITWFNLAPKAMAVRIGGKRVPGILIAGPQYVAWAIVSAAVAWLLLHG